MIAFSPPDSGSGDAGLDLLSNRSSLKISECSAVVLGLDVIGFSSTLENLIGTYGAAATEWISDAIGTIHARADGVMSEYGFEWGDSLGDGLFVFRPSTSGIVPEIEDGALGRLVEDLEKPFAFRWGELRARAAWSRGHVQRCFLGGWGGTTNRFVTGTAVASLHRAMGQRRLHGLAVAVPPAPRPGLSLIASTETSPSAVRSMAEQTPEKALFGEVREAGILFCRIRDDGDDELVRPERVHAAVHLGQCISDSFNGHFEKVTHDDKGILLMFVFGPSARLGREQAIECAWELDRQFTEIRLQSTIGVSCGTFYRGPIRTGPMVSMAVYGSAVNRAAKLVTTAKGGVILDQSPLQPAIIGAVDTSFAPALIEDRRWPTSLITPWLVGRAQEIAYVRAWVTSTAASSRILVVSGEPGVGKSAFLSHLAQTELDAVCSFVATRPQRTLDHHWIWREIIRDLLAKVVPNEDTWQPFIRASLEEAGLDSVAFEVFSDFQRLSLGTDGLVRDLTGGTRLAALEAAIVAVLKRLEARARLLIIIDDVQWADFYSLQLMRELSRTLLHTRLLLGERERGGDEDHHHKSLPIDQPCLRVHLSGLGPDDLKTLIESNTTAKLTSPQLRQLWDLTAGNPFSALQLTLANPHFDLDLVTGEWNSSKADRSEILLRALDMRLDILAGAEMALLRILSIADRALNADQIMELAVRAGFDGSSGAMQHLETAALLSSETLGSGKVYAVRHRLLAERVTARLPASVKVQLHMYMARLLPRVSEFTHERSSEAEIGLHWEQAGDTTRAALHFARGAESAMEAGAYSTALELYRRAEQLLEGRSSPAPNVLAGWIANRAAAAWAMGDIADAMMSARRARELVDRKLAQAWRISRAAPWSVRWLRTGSVLVAPIRRQIPRRLRAPLALSGVIEAETGQFRGDLYTILNGNFVSLAFATDDAVRVTARARSFAFGGYLASLAGLHRLSSTMFERGCAVSALQADQRPAAYCFAAQAVACFARGQWADGMGCLTAVDNAVGQAPEPHIIEIRRTLSALAAHFQGDWVQAKEEFITVLDSAARRGNRLHEAWGYYGQAQALLSAGHVRDALALLDSADRLLERSGDRQSLLICAGLRASACLANDDAKGAVQHAQAALALGRSIPPTNFSSLEGYSAPCVVAAHLLQRPQRSVSRPELVTLSNVGVPVLRRFAWLFPIARPRLELARAMSATVAGKLRIAEQHANRARRAAEVLGMKGELRAIDRWREVQCNDDRRT
ncbi:AAA family ATPase [Microvirga sp. 3-52]|uniref:ATP-binding protein n=1 Tax=Microvirga sp. 3-52 TaxID=2792425 RepID=UPI001AC7BD93|nr:AAA family ATPase [Microvirga sp. 3-52]MBO1908878.1 AAA family ATPase [Microvirga sp. 3-52]MBS7455210.1 AAA family ATPase [Microvirga sp. 3-52]